MRAILVALAAVVALASQPASAANRVRWLGLGIVAGLPSAIDLKLWAGAYFGVDVGFGIAGFEPRLGGYVDVEVAILTIGMGGGVVGELYGGFGGAVAFPPSSDAGQDLVMAVTFPVGLDVQLPAPISLFLEGRPGVLVYGGSGFELGGHAGIRYVF